MKKRKKLLYIIAGILLVFLLSGISLFQLSKSRTYQFAGEIIPRVETEKKVVALTLDDGPSKHTDEILRILKEKNVKATFFVIGKDLEENPEAGTAIIAAGHELGNHTYSHQRMWLKSQEFIADELQRTDVQIRKTGYKGTIHFRPPYGKKLVELPKYLEQHNIKTIMWDVEPDTYGSSPEFIIYYTLQHTKPGSIILLHPFCEDCTGQRESISTIIDNLHEQGYTFVTVSELLEYK